MGEAQQNCREKKLYICQTSEDEFLDVSKSFCETDTAKSPVEKENNVKTDESLKQSTTKKRRVSENTLGLERFGKDFSLKITRSLSPTLLGRKLSRSPQPDPVFHLHALHLVLLLLHNKQDDHHF